MKYWGSTTVLELLLTLDQGRSFDHVICLALTSAKHKEESTNGLSFFCCRCNFLKEEHKRVCSKCCKQKSFFWPRKRLKPKKQYFTFLLGIRKWSPTPMTSCWFSPVRLYVTICIKTMYMSVEVATLSQIHKNCKIW